MVKEFVGLLLVVHHCVVASRVGYKEGCGEYCSWEADAGTVEMGCQFKMRIGLEATTTKATLLGPALALDDGKKIVLTPDDVNATTFFEAKVAPAICFDAGVPQSTKGPILLLVSNSVTYLWRLWPYFVNKVLWARSIHLRTALWIGELPRSLAGATDQCRGSALMAGKKKKKGDRRKLPSSLYLKRGHDVNSNHFIKALAASSAKIKFKYSAT